MRERIIEASGVIGVMAVIVLLVISMCFLDDHFALRLCAANASVYASNCYVNAPSIR